MLELERDLATPIRVEENRAASGSSSAAESGRFACIVHGDTMVFEFDTYVVLDVPSPFAEQVMAIRERCLDWFRASFPVEITVAGSGGVGVIDPQQNWREAFITLNAIAAETPPIVASFGSAHRFPNTNTFVLTLRDEGPFRKLHERISTSGLKFRPSPFPFTPHCTLCTRSDITEKQTTELLAVQIPGEFTIDTISVYMLNRLPVTLLHRTQLTGATGTKHDR